MTAPMARSQCSQLSFGRPPPPQHTGTTSNNHGYLCFSWYFSHSYVMVDCTLPPHNPPSFRWSYAVGQFFVQTLAKRTIIDTNEPPFPKTVDVINFKCHFPPLPLPVISANLTTLPPLKGPVYSWIFTPLKQGI